MDTRNRGDNLLIVTEQVNGRFRTQTQDDGLVTEWLSDAMLWYVEQEAPWGAEFSDFHFLILKICISQFYQNFLSFLKIVVQVQFSAISPHPYPPPQPTSPVFTAPSPPAPPCYCPGVLYNCFCKPFTLSPTIPSPLPSGRCQPVLNFNVFGYILLACSFCWLGSR